MDVFKKYILDANVFIEAALRYYSFDSGYKFWDFLKEKSKNNLICSIDKVLKEIQKGDKNDPLREWAEKDFKDYFFSTENDKIIQSYTTIIQYVYNNNQYTKNAKNEFMKEYNAGAWVIAFAKYIDLIVVTHENYNPYSKKKVLIPNVCNNFKIKYIDTFEMLKELNFKL